MAKVSLTESVGLERAWVTKDCGEGLWRGAVGGTGINHSLLALGSIMQLLARGKGRLFLAWHCWALAVGVGTRRDLPKHPKAESWAELGSVGTEQVQPHPTLEQQLMRLWKGFPGQHNPVITAMSPQRQQPRHLQHALVHQPSQVHPAAGEDQVGVTQGPAQGLGAAELGVRTVCGGMDWWVPPVGHQNFPALGVPLGAEAAD